MINFPTSLDTLTNPVGTDQLTSPDHAGQHSNVNDAVEALEAKVGADSSAVTTSHDYKLSEVTSTDKAVGKTATQTLTNKTLTAPAISTITNGGTITVPSGTDTLVGKATTDTLTNKTLTAPKIANGGFIADANGNEQIIFNTTGSAVNEVSITNAATGTTGPLIAASGETNVDLRVGAKGTGKVALQSKLNMGANTAYFTETDNGNSSTADTIDWGVSNKQKSTLTGNCTFTFTAPPGPCSLILKLVQDGGGSRTVTWPATVHWPGGTAPTLTTVGGKVDLITFYYDGSTYFGNSSLNYTA